MMIIGWSVWNAINFFPAVSQDCMSSLFIMLGSLWMVFLEYRTEFFWSFSLTKGTEVYVDSIAGVFWWSEDKVTGALSDKVESYDWLYL